MANRSADWLSQARRDLEQAEDSRVAGDLIERAQVLDTFYIPARYPNSHPEGAPFEHYGSLPSEEAIEHARAIVGFVDHQVA